MVSTVLVVAAHPDDEVLGCGGVMAKHASTGDDVYTLFLAEGGGASRALGSQAVFDADQTAIQGAASEAAATLGTRDPRFLGFPDNQMDSVPLLDIVKAIEDVVESLRPDIVYTHHHADLNVDHQIAHQAVLTACRPLPDSPVKSIYCFETLSSTEWASPRIENGFLPNRYVSVETELETKLNALKCYQMEMRAFPHPRSYEAVRALAITRGAAVGLPAAEAFEVVREIVS